MINKTVMDAVNEFEGEWRTGNKFLCNDTSKDHWIFTDNPRVRALHGNYHLVCSIEEFNQYVQECEANLGNGNMNELSNYRDAVSLGNAPIAKPSQPALMDEDSSQFKISNIGNVLHNMSCSMEDEDEQNEFGGYASFCWDLSDELRKSECKDSTDKPTQPVFTQAMADNGEFPKAGMLCLINFPDIDNAWYEYTIDFIGKHTVIASCKDVAERFGHVDDIYFKPIDTRTDKEKLKGEINGIWNNSADKWQTIDVIVNSLVEDELTGVKWVGE
jgi:hypothetical protein